MKVLTNNRMDKKDMTMKITTKVLLIALSIGLIVNVQAMERSAHSPSLEKQEELNRAIALSQDEDAAISIQEQPQSAEELSSLLLDAWHREDAESVIALLDQGACVKTKNNGGRTMLHDAVADSLLPVCSYLIDKGADVNAKNHVGNSPLHDAAKDGNAETCHLLVSRGADVNARNNKGLTPLHWAVKRGQLAALLQLIADGADMNVTDHEGKTPRNCLMSSSEPCALLLDLAREGVWVVPIDFSQMTEQFRFLEDAIPLMYLACPSTDKLSVSRACLAEALLCMNRICRNVPRDIRQQILYANDDRATDSILVLYYNLWQGRALTGIEMSMLKSLLPCYMKRLIALPMWRYLEHGYSNLPGIDDPMAMLEEKFGEVITTNVHARLDELQQKALEKSNG